MYSITQSPSLAVDLARSIQDEHLRRAAAHHRPPKQTEATDRKRPHRPRWPHRWTPRPAAAI